MIFDTHKNMATSPTTTRPAISAKDLSLLSEYGVPAISLHDACKACDDPCFDDDEDTHPDQVGPFNEGLL